MKVSMSDLQANQPRTAHVSESEPTTALVTERDAQAARGPSRSRAVAPPTLALGHSIGDLGATFGAGNFVLDKAIGLGKEIEVILLDHPQICFVQDLKYGESDERPDIVYAKSIAPADIAAAEDEVLNRGGVLRKEEADGQHTHYRLGANVVLLIKAPESVSEEERGLFPYRLGGHDYAAALYYIRKSAYKTAVGQGFGRSRLWLKDAPWGAPWRVRSKTETYLRNTYPVPIATMLTKFDPEKDAELLAELAQLSEGFRFQGS